MRSLSARQQAPVPIHAPAPVPAPVRWQRWLPVLALLLVLAGTPWQNFSLELWSDEAFTASYMEHANPVQVLEDVRKNEETPPFYFLVLWVWSRVAGQSEVALRLPSLLFGATAVVLFSRAVQRWLSPMGALVATVTFALSPLVSKYLVEARCYMLLLLLCVVCVLFFEHIVCHLDRPYNWLVLDGYMLAAAALFLTFYVSVVLLAAQSLVWLVLLVRRRHKPDWRRHLITWVVVQGCIAAMTILWLPSLLYQIAVSDAVINMPGLSPVISLLMSMSILFYYPPTPWLWQFWVLNAGGFWLVILMGLLFFGKEEYTYGRLIRIFGVPALLFGLFHIITEANTPRYLMPLVPGAALGVGVGWQTLRDRRPHLGTPLAGLLLAGLLLYRVAAAFAPPARDTAWAETARIVAQQVDPQHDAVLFHPPWEQRTFDYYYDGPDVPFLGAHHYDDFYYFEEHSFRDAWTVQDAVEATQHYQRVWVVQNPERYRQIHSLGLPYSLLEQWGDEESEPLLVLYQVSKPATLGDDP